MAECWAIAKRCLPVSACDAVRLAGELGLDLIGIRDHPYPPGFLDTWTLIAAALASQTRQAMFCGRPGDEEPWEWPVQRWADLLIKLAVEDGIDSFVFGPRRGTREQMHLWAGEVAPQVRATAERYRRLGSNHLNSLVTAVRRGDMGSFDGGLATASNPQRGASSVVC